jgi:hypothetical protein
VPFNIQTFIFRRTNIHPPIDTSHKAVGKASSFLASRCPPLSVSCRLFTQIDVYPGLEHLHLNLRASLFHIGSDRRVRRCASDPTAGNSAQRSLAAAAGRLPRAHDHGTVQDAAVVRLAPKAAGHPAQTSQRPPVAKQ